MSIYTCLMCENSLQQTFLTIHVVSRNNHKRYFQVSFALREGLSLITFSSTCFFFFNADSYHQFGLKIFRLALAECRIENFVNWAGNGFLFVLTSLKYESKKCRKKSEYIRNSNIFSNLFDKFLMMSNSWQTQIAKKAKTTTLNVFLI